MVIAHCSQTLAQDDPAFLQAVALAARSGAAVRGIHLQRGFAAELPPPSAAALLEHWQRRELRIDHDWMLEASAQEPGDALLKAIARIRPELLIMRTHARSGLARLFVGSVAESVARNVSMPVLLLPIPGPALIDADTGALGLTRALLCAGSREDTERAVGGLRVLTELAAISTLAVEIFHVDDGTPLPRAVLPPEFDVTTHHGSGSFERAVMARVRESPPDLIVMTSHGHDQLSDVIRSSHTERVLHEVRRPLLWVPARRRAD